MTPPSLCEAPNLKRIGLLELYYFLICHILLKITPVSEKAENKKKVQRGWGEVFTFQTAAFGTCPVLGCSSQNPAFMQ